MKKRIVSLILALCMLLSTGFVLASCAIDKESEKESSSDKVSMSNFVKKLGYLDEKGELDDLEVLEGDAAASEIEGAVKYVEAESEDGEGFWAVEFKEESRAKEFYEEMKAAAEEDDEGVTFKRSGKIVYAYSDKAFYDRIMAAKAPASQTPGGSTDSTDKPGSSTDKPSEPSWSANEELVATLLTADSAKELIADIKDLVVETVEKELDYNALLSKFNLYAEVEGEKFSIKDGYIVYEDEAPYNDRFVIGIKDAMFVGVENGEATGHESLEVDIPTDELDAIAGQAFDAIDMVVAQGLFLEITKEDIEYKNGWYCIKESYLANAIMNVIEKMMAAEMPEDEVTPEMEEQMNAMKVQMQTMIDAVLAQADIIIGFAMDGDKLNGVKIAVKANDIDSLVSSISPEDAGMMTGSIEMSIEAKLTADLSKFAYFDVYADVDADVDGVEMVETFDLRLEYANNAITLAADIDLAAEESVFDINFTVTLALDAEGMPTFFSVKGNANIKGVEVSDASGSYQIGGMNVTNIYAYGTGDLAVSVNAFIDFTKLAGTGEAIKVDISMSTSNVVIETYADNAEYYGITEQMILDSLGKGQLDELNKPESLNGRTNAILVTVNGEGTLSSTMTDKYGDIVSASVEVAVNSDKALVPTQAEKNAIANYVPVVEEK